MQLQLDTAFEALYGREPKPGERGDPYRLAELRRAYPALPLNRKQRLKSEVLLHFPRIAEKTGGAVYFGGGQNWFPRKTQRMAGCGPVAAANTLATYASLHPAKRAALGVPAPKDGVLPKEGYEVLMERVYKGMGTLEIPLWHNVVDRQNPKKVRFMPSFGQQAAGFLRGTLLYAQRRGVLLCGEVAACAYLRHEVGLSFIERGLAAGSPVTLLTTWNRHPLAVYRSGYDAPATPQPNGMAKHFVTVVGVRKNALAGHAELLVSSWGQVCVVPYGALHASWQSPKAFGAALFRFAQSENAAHTKRQIAGAYKVLANTMGKTAAGVLRGKK